MQARLPIHELEGEIVARLRETPRLVVSAPTGSGKSTQVPQMLLRNGLLDRGQAVVLQPRRIAARLLAARVAEERDVPLGSEVGYQVRLESACGAETKIRYVTEGILLRQMIEDLGLAGVSTLLFDEFHERHLYGDVTLARALDLQERSRPDLKIVVMSATLDVDRLAAYLKPCATLASEGRAHPVRIEYRPLRRPDEPVWEQAAEAFAGYVKSGGDGDVLVFMPGAYEIARAVDGLRGQPEAKGFLVLPLHGELSSRDQDAAVARYRQRKVVVATNVAETSITIEGIHLVIDSGLARVPRHDPYRGINTLRVEKVSRASADQRAGRAGRTAPGTCIRLWDEEEHAQRPGRQTPEVRRLDLSEAVLMLKAAGVEDLRAFRWLDPPEEPALAHAEDLLEDLQALEAGRITDLGRRMLSFPVHPRYARMLLAARDSGCVYPAALVAALTQGRDLMLRHVGRDTAEFREERLVDRATSDFQLLIRAWEYAAKNDFRLESCRRAGLHAGTARQVAPLLERFLGIAGREGIDPRQSVGSDEALRKCILVGFPDRVARRAEPGTLRYELARGRRGTLARESVARNSDLLVAAEAREVEGKGGEVNTILSLATSIEAPWLHELFPRDISRRSHVAYDPAARRVIAEEWVCFRDLALEKRRAEPPPEEEAARLLAREVLAGRLAIKAWDESVEQWILRVNLLSRSCPELGLPAIDADARRALVEKLCRGAASYREIKDRPVTPVVRGWLDPPRATLVEKHVPERLELPNGKRPRVVYAAEGVPAVAVKIQDLYGVTSVPPLALGRVTPLVRILAPNMRLVQVTQDLAGFWRDHYPRVLRELRRRYPKHEWRECP